MTLDFAQRLLVDDLIVRSAMLIDRMELEAWASLFAPEARYMVIPRENRDRGYPAAIINCQTRPILQDRIAVLRKSAKYNPHVDRHLLSRTEFRQVERDIVKTETNFMIVQSSLEGMSKLFCAGVYEDTIAIANNEARFQERVAVLDTFSVPNLIATPI